MCVCVCVCVCVMLTVILNVLTSIVFYFFIYKPLLTSIANTMLI